MELKKVDINYFKRGAFENPKFWSNFGGKPSLIGTNVLDLGCGHGSLCIDIALSGASKVVGIDTNSMLINFAQENLKQNYPHLKKRIEFLDINLRDYQKGKFDYIISKDAFEHILDLKMIIKEMNKLLKLKGRIYSGFGPLYQTPYGDHGRTKALVPYGHLLIPEHVIINRVNRRRENKITSIQELGLNKMSLSDYHKLFSLSGLDIIYFEANQGSHIILRLSSLIRKIHTLYQFFAFNLYCILEKVGVN